MVDWLEREMVYSDLNVVSIPLVLFMVLSLELSRLVRIHSHHGTSIHQYSATDKVVGRCLSESYAISDDKVMGKLHVKYIAQYSVL